MKADKGGAEKESPEGLFLKLGLLGLILMACGAAALGFPQTRLAAFGFLCGFGYGLGFRWLGLGAGARWLLLAKIPILLLLLAGLGHLGQASLLCFPAGFIAQLLDFIVQLRLRGRSSA